MTGPGPMMDAPFAGTWFTVSNWRLVSKPQTRDPSRVEYARSAPSTEPANSTPGMTVIATGWAALQPRPRAPHINSVGGEAIQAAVPEVRFTACTPPGRGQL